MKLDQLQTPALLLDPEKLDRNIESMHRHLAGLNVRFRPHGKTVKNIEAMRRVLSKEFGGITVSTVAEAEYYASAGIQDLLYAVGIAPNKLGRISGLIRNGARISLLLDSVEQAVFVSEHALSAGIRIPVLIEIDSDGHRAGVPPESSDLLEIAGQLSVLEGVYLDGVMTHAGASYGCRTGECLRAMARQERDAAVKAAGRLREAGYTCPVVSVGSSPTATFAEDLTGVTEVRAGVYMTGDLVMAGLGVCRVEDIALSVLTSVIGQRQDRNRVITDAGWMALSRDRGFSDPELHRGYGLVCDRAGIPIHPEVIVSDLNQEHGLLTRRDGGPVDWRRFPVGGLLRILPNHACATAAMFDAFVIPGNDGSVRDTWKRCRGW